MSIPDNHPRYRSLLTRERLATCAQKRVVALEGLIAHGRGEAFDYLLGERTTASAALAEQIAAALLRKAEHPVISVNGNTAALAASLIAALQRATHASVEVNLFHRTDERVQMITSLLNKEGISVLTGPFEPLIPLSHDRALCLRKGIFSADVVLVPLEDGDRCQALRGMGKQVIAIDLNPLSRTARAATLTIVDELTRALPRITEAALSLDDEECERLIRSFDNRSFLRSALEEMKQGLTHGMD